jgi:ribosomal RNA-processing protein 36
MESQQKTRENKEKLQNVTRDHKKNEKELVKQGKKPFFLKKCMFKHLHQSTLYVLSDYPSRAKEDRFGRPLPEHEVETARQSHRTPPQEGYCKGTEEYARRATCCLITDLTKAARSQHGESRPQMHLGFFITDEELKGDTFIITEALMHIDQQQKKMKTSVL